MLKCTLVLSFLFVCVCFSPKFELPTSDPATQAKKASIVCHYCAEIGHKAANCQKIPPEMKMEQQQQVKKDFLIF